MKKFLIALLAILAVACTVLTLTACNRHKHEYGEWIEAVDATCSHAGNVGHYHCDGCGKDFDKDFNEIENVTVAKLAHTWDDGEVTVPATCETEGKKLFTCKVCGDKKTEAVNALGHDWNTGEILLQPTCTATGERKQTCLTCGKTRTVEMEKLEHNFELIPALAPTCEASGHGERQQCSVCGYVLPIDNAIPPLGHTFGEWETLIAATDDHAGLQIRTCTVCHNKSETRDIEQKSHVWGEFVYDFDKGTHTRKCQNSDCGRTDTQGCVYNRGEVVAPTCTKDGYTLYTCQLCNHTMQGEQTTALDHNYGDFTADYVGVENFENHVHTHSRICKRCNDVDTEPCSQTTEKVIDPTCTTGGYTTYTCNTCGSVHETDPQQALGHKFSQWAYDTTNADMHTQTCQTCLTVERQACVYDDEVTLPTCTDGGFTTHTCSVCAHQYVDAQVEAYGHAFGDFTYNGNGETNTHTHSCARCQTVETKDCEMVEVKQAETCTTDGSITRTCKYCLVTFTEEGAKSLGHDFTEFADADNGKHTRSCKRCSTVDEQAHVYETSTVSAADCENARVVKNTCTVCSSSYTESVGNPLGHSWGDYVANADLKTHTRVCQRDDNHVEQLAHSFTTTNLCNQCSYDCLTYKFVGGHYVVYADNRLTSSIKEIIIADKHSEVGGDLYDVTQICEKAFMGNRYITSVRLPATVTTIGEYAFYGCSALTSVTVESGSALTDIGYSAFMNCGELVSMQLPEGLVSIAGYAFCNNEKLFEIDVPESVQSLGCNAFMNTACYNDANRWTEGVLYLGKHLIAANSSVRGEYTVKDGTISIGYMAFSKCKELTFISLPRSLNYVERDAFLGCEALTSVAYGGTMDDWFAITFISDASSPLYYAARLNIEQATGDVVIPDGITSIPAGTFRGTAITSIKIPDTVTFIGEEAFENCEQLTVINIPDSVKYIGANAFANCGYYNDASKWVSGVLYVGNHLIASKANELAGNYRVKDGTVTIGIDAFRNCADLTQVTIVSTVVRIGANAFEGCTNLTGIVFEDTSFKWLANRIDSLTRLLSANDLSTGAKALEQFQYYNGEWKRWN